MNLESIAKALAAHGGFWAYLTLFVATFLEGVFPPVPSDVIVLFCTLLVVQGSLHWIPVLALSFLGGIAGALLVYWIGARHGRSWLLAKPRPFLPPRRFAEMESHFGRYGNLILALNRVVIGGRSIGFLVAGLSHYPLRRVLLFGAPGTLGWYALLVALGTVFGEQAQQFVSAIVFIVMALLVLSAISVIITRKIMK
jgi:membrane protein DedA with SNARE-associated domain